MSEAQSYGAAVGSSDATARTSARGHLVLRRTHLWTAAARGQPVLRRAGGRCALGPPAGDGGHYGPGARACYTRTAFKPQLA